MSSRFTRIAVRSSVQSKVYTVVYLDIDEQKHAVGTTPDGTVIPLKGSMLAITASQHGSDSFRLGERGSVSTILASKISRKPETLKALINRNPWNNSKALLFREALKS